MEDKEQDKGKLIHVEGRVSPKVFAEMAAEMERRDWTQSQLVRRAIEAFLRKE